MYSYIAIGTNDKLMSSPLRLTVTVGHSYPAVALWIILQLDNVSVTLEQATFLLKFLLGLMNSDGCSRVRKRLLRDMPKHTKHPFSSDGHILEPPTADLSTIIKIK